MALAIRFIIVLSVLQLMACGKPDGARRDVLVLGHGGAGFDGINNPYTPNTEESIKSALLLQGADGVEVDIQITSDSVVVLFHDDVLDGVTNASGYVSDHTWEELSTVLYKRSGARIERTQHIWRLEDLLTFLKKENLDVWLSLNIHPQLEVNNPDKYNLQFGESLQKTLSAYPFNQKVILESPDTENLIIMNGFIPTGARLFFTAPITEENLMFAHLHHITGFVTNYLDESLESIQEAQNQGFEVALYGVKIRQDILPALNFKPDYVQTDNVPLTLSYLED